MCLRVRGRIGLHWMPIATRSAQNGSRKEGVGFHTCDGKMSKSEKHVNEKI